MHGWMAYAYRSQALSIARDMMLTSDGVPCQEAQIIPVLGAWHFQWVPNGDLFT